MLSYDCTDTKGDQGGWNSNCDRTWENIVHVGAHKQQMFARVGARVIVLSVDDVTAVRLIVLEDAESFQATDERIYTEDEGHAVGVILRKVRPA